MRTRRLRFKPRQAGVTCSLAISLAGTPFASSASAQVHAPRILPSNALQPPGASFEEEPAVHGTQVVRILRDSFHASADTLLHAPLRSAAQVSGRGIERMAVRAHELAPRSLLPPHDRDCGTHSPAELGGTFGGPLTPASLSLLPTSEASIGALLQLIGEAHGRIDLMMYGWEDDPTGREVASALAARAQQGVRIRLLVDRTGYLIHNAAAARDCPTFLDALRTVPNVTVIESPGPFLRFDHRKLAVIDGRTVWSGGMILTEVARRRWHNLAIVAEGPIVEQYACLFDARWLELGGYPEPFGATAGDTPAPPPNADVRMIRTDLGIRSLRDAIYHAADNARYHIYLENPYFTDEILTDKLVSARARGVDVRVVLTLRGNVERVNHYMSLTANRLFRGGVRVYLFPAMTHVKAMSVDGVWAYIGSGNFDELSLRNNREVGLSVTGPDLVNALDSSLFLPDMAASQELSALLPRPRHRLLLESFALWY